MAIWKQALSIGSSGIGAPSLMTFSDGVPRDMPHSEAEYRADTRRPPVSVADRVSVIIPAHNEADVIGDTIRAARGIPDVFQVIVVDDASTDGTGAVALDAGAHRVLSLPQNLGKGGALNKAWPLAEGDILLLLDADLGRSASEGSKLLDPVLRGEADMVVGILGRSRVSANEHSEGPSLAAKSGGFGIVVMVARLGIRLLTGRTFQAPLSGQRALRREIPERIGGFESKFGVEVGLTIDTLRMGCTVVEVPVDMVHRASGRDLKGFIHRGKQMLDVLRTLWRKALIHA